jgi:hypothetical protein
VSASRQRRRLAALAPSAALIVLVASAAPRLADAAAAPARLFLALIAGAVFAALGVVRPDRTELALLPVLAAPALLLLPASEPLTLAVVFGLAALGVVATVGDSPLVPLATGGSAMAALVFAAQLVVHGHLLWSAPADPRTWGLLALAPALVTAGLRVLAQVRGELALVAGLASFAAGPGWGAIGVAALGSAAVAARLVGRRSPAVPTVAVALAAPAAAFGDEPPALVAALGVAAALALAADPRWRRAGRAAIATAALVALFAGAPPWLRRAPLAAALGGVVQRPTAAGQQPLAGRAAALGDERRRLEWALDGSPVGEVVVDSFLADAVGLPCGVPAARLSLEQAGRRLAEGVLEVGTGTGEWAAGRGDVAARLGCETSEPFAHWLVADGRFLGRRYRARFRLPKSVAADRLSIELEPSLGRPARLILTGVTVR